LTLATKKMRDLLYQYQKTNIAPENRPSQKDVSSSNHQFSGTNVSFRGSSSLTPGDKKLRDLVNINL